MTTAIHPTDVDALVRENAELRTRAEHAEALAAKLAEDFEFYKVQAGDVAGQFQRLRDAVGKVAKEFCV